MKRFRLATKLALAIVPIALVALATGALVSWTFLEEARAEERVSVAARVAADAMDALVAVSAEQAATLEVALGNSDASLEGVRDRSDSALERLRDSVRDLVPRAAGPASGIASAIFSDSSLAQARVEDAREDDPLSGETDELYDEIGSRLITVASQATLYFGDEGRAREGAGAIALARASFASSQQERLMARLAADQSLIDAEQFEQQFASFETTVADWLNNADDNSPTVTALGLARTQVLEPGTIPDAESFPDSRDQLLADTAAEILERVAASAAAAATTVRTEAVTVAAVVLGVLFVTMVIALVVGRSTVRRVRSVTTAARHVAEVDLPKMVDALSNPTGQLEGTIPVELEQAGPDEVGELARSFSALHSTLVEVANRQMEILRRGVSEIFVTLARRNGSLVDRQLALIDELESGEENPEVLDGYYKLDHLSTRMRRNAESLLVLAGSESPRMWSEPLDMGEVVRAALGEVDEYQRVDVLALEPARLKGRVVTDLAHLMSELLDNATQFSPPSERVRVTALFDDNGYAITIADSGLGISEARMTEINRLIENPPVLGLALEPTLGMYVVARLAARHDISVRLVPGVPGTTVRITLPRTLLHTTVEAPTEKTPRLPASSAVAPPAVANGTAPDQPKSATIPPYAFRSGSHDGENRQTPTARPAKPAARADQTRRETAGADRPPADQKATEGESVPAEPSGSGGSQTSAFAVSDSPPTLPGGESRAADRATEPSKPVRSAGDIKVDSPPPSVARTERPTSAEGPLPMRPTGEPRRPPAGAPGESPPATPSPDDAAAQRQTGSPAERSQPLPAERSGGETRPFQSWPETRPIEPAPIEFKAQPQRTPRPVDSTDSSPPRPQQPGAESPAAGLPTRNPGSSFQGDISTEGSTTVSKRGAEGIRNALDGYRLGRDIAVTPPKRHQGGDHPSGGESGSNQDERRES